MKRVQVMPMEMDGTSKKVRADRQYCYKFLAPTRLCSSLMGPGGKIIQEIQAETDTFIQFTDRNALYPNTCSRVASVQGSTVEGLVATIKTVVGHLAECSTTPARDEDNMEIGSGDNLYFSMLVPRPIRGVIIGPAGQQVSDLRKMSRTKINLDDGLSMDSVVKIEGHAEGICAVALWINEKLCEATGETYFGTWMNASDVPLCFDGGYGHNHPNSGYSNQMSQPRHNNNRRFGSDIPQGRRFGSDLPQHVFGNEEGYQEMVPIMTAPIMDGGNSDRRQPRFPTNVAEIVERVSNDVNNDGQIHHMQIPLPLKYKGAIIGKGGCGVKEIMQESLCNNLNVNENGDCVSCTVNIQGSVMACTAAYLLVMRRYLTHVDGARGAN